MLWQAMTNLLRINDYNLGGRRGGWEGKQDEHDKGSNSKEQDEQHKEYEPQTKTNKMRE